MWGSLCAVLAVLSQGTEKSSHKIINVHKLDTLDETLMFIGPEWRNRSVVLGVFGQHEKGKMMALWRASTATAYSRDMLTWGMTTHQHIADYLRVTMPAMLIFNPYKSKPQTWMSKTDSMRVKNAIVDFTKINVQPLVGEFDGSRSQGLKLMSSSVKQMVILLLPGGTRRQCAGGEQQQCQGGGEEKNTTKVEEAIDALRALGHDFFGKAHFFFASQESRRVNYFFRLKSVSTPGYNAVNVDGSLPVLVHSGTKPGSRPTFSRPIESDKHIRDFLTEKLGPPDRWKALASVGKFTMPEIAQKSAKPSRKRAKKAVADVEFM